MTVDFGNRKTQIITGIIVLVIIGVIAFFAFGGSSSTTNSTTTPTAPKGYTIKPTVTTLPPSVPHPATAPPASPPPKIYATGACETAMNTLRALFTQYKSGLALDSTGAANLTTDLKTLGTACTATQDQAFRTQELTPWLDYTVPK